MNNPGGFYLEALEVGGKDKPDAVLPLKPGLNVISGPSNTGKSYILQCIDFMLGAKDKPKAQDIKEGQGYETAYLTIRSMEHEPITLERALKGGSFRCFRNKTLPISSGDEGEVLGEQHDADTTATISGLLLSLCGLWGRRVLKNKDGETQSLSFRNIVPLCIISEDRIFVDSSPVLVSNNAMLRTLEASVVRLLLTGNDDSSIVGKKVAATKRTQIDAQISLIDKWIAQAEQNLVEVTTDAGGVDDQIRRADAAIEDLSQSLASHREELWEQQESRRRTRDELVKAESRLIMLIELLSRFDLLRQHYGSDLARLAAIREANHLFFQLSSRDCPLCGASSNGKPVRGTVSESQIEEACSREMAKIKGLLADLAETTKQLAAERQQLSSRRAGLVDAFEQTNRRIEEFLVPTAKTSKQEVQQLLTVRQSLERASQIISQIASYREQRESLLAERPRKVANVTLPTGLRIAEVEGLCQVIEGLLQAWGYPDHGRVTFSEKDQDLVIAGRGRRSPGKGYRALTYAAFAIGLLKYCRQNKLPHPGFVVIDSPLVAFREPDEGEEKLGDDVKRVFYETLADSPATEQIVIIENEDPPASVWDKINYIHFTKSKRHGRHGFFEPVAESEEGPTEAPEPTS
jgi:ABC-type transporter Mla subunit MlaD